MSSDETHDLAANEAVVRRFVEPTGRTFDGEGIVVARIADGKTAERGASSDALGLLRPLGLVSGPGVEE
ncbi:hypothetical protein [Salinigranum sp.]|uniref:hypothetical protein n=1 Tax=Salinigranum sp. TaxID=1966351 RepID=UPI0035628499